MSNSATGFILAMEISCLLIFIEKLIYAKIDMQVGDRGGSSGRRWQRAVVARRGRYRVAAEGGLSKWAVEMVHRGDLCSGRG
jgi:hypothetical protein